MVQSFVRGSGKENAVKVGGDSEGVEVSSHVFSAHPQGKTSTSDLFTRDVFEGTLDKVSRPVKGTYADALPSSEEYIRDKRREAELEDRPS